MAVRLERYKQELGSITKRLENEIEDEKSLKLFQTFAQTLLAKDITPGRVTRYLYCLRDIYEIIGQPVDTWETEELTSALADIRMRDLSPHTKYEYQKTLRKFFKWYRGEKWEHFDVLKGKKKIQKNPDILQENEVLELIGAAERDRDKALIAVTYEGGLRAGEALGLKVGDVEFNNKGAKLKVSGKTGERKPLIVFSVPYLTQWLEEHPHKDDYNAPLFTSLAHYNYGGRLSSYGLAKVLNDAAKKTSIKKRVYPHILRHSRCTVMANVMTEAQMCQYFGWVQGSDMPSIYVHLSGRDVDRSVLKYYGLLEEEEEEETKQTRPKKCPRCNETNGPTAQFCQRCGFVLDEKERAKAQIEETKSMDQVMNEILSDSDLREDFKKKIKWAEIIENDPEKARAIYEAIENKKRKE